MIFDCATGDMRFSITVTDIIIMLYSRKLRVDAYYNIIFEASDYQKKGLLAMSWSPRTEFFVTVIIIMFLWVS